MVAAAEPRVVEQREGAPRVARGEVVAQPLELRRVRPAAARDAVAGRVEDDDVPRPDVLRVPRRAVADGAVAEVVRVAGGVTGLVLVVAGHGELDPVLEAAPRRPEAVAELLGAAVVVGVVAEREHDPRPPLDERGRVLVVRPRRSGRCRPPRRGRPRRGPASGCAVGVGSGVAVGRRADGSRPRAAVAAASRRRAGRRRAAGPEPRGAQQRDQPEHDEHRADGREQCRDREPNRSEPGLAAWGEATGSARGSGELRIEAVEAERPRARSAGSSSRRSRHPPRSGAACRGA